MGDPLVSEPDNVMYDAITRPTRGFDTPSAVLRFLPSGRVPEDPTELITSAIVGRSSVLWGRSRTSC